MFSSGTGIGTPSSTVSTMTSPLKPGHRNGNPALAQRVLNCATPSRGVKTMVKEDYSDLGRNSRDDQELLEAEDDFNVDEKITVNVKRLSFGSTTSGKVFFSSSSYK